MGEDINNQAGRPEESLPVNNGPQDMAATIMQLARRHPLGATALAFGASVLIGWFIAQDLKSRFSSRIERMGQKLSEDVAYKEDISHWEGEGGAIPLPESEG